MLWQGIKLDRVQIVISDLPVKDRLLSVGTTLFAEKGFDGVSVREICKTADTSMNMIHHYFGNKDGLLTAIIEGFTEQVFAFPLRILDKKPETQEEFIMRMGLFFEETLTALINQRSVLHVMIRHDIEATAMSELQQKFIEFIASAQSKGFLQQGFEAELISGFLLDRLTNQVLYAPQIAKYSGDDLLGDADYRTRWVKSNLNVFLYGLVKP